MFNVASQRLGKAQCQAACARPGDGERGQNRGESEADADFGEGTFEEVNNRHSSRGNVQGYLDCHGSLRNRRSMMENTAHHRPNHHTSPPKPSVTPNCHAIPHAIANKYFGLNTVQMNRCVLSAVQLAMTLASITPVNSVSSLTWFNHDSLYPPRFPDIPSADLACACKNSCSCCTQLLAAFISVCGCLTSSRFDPYPPSNSTPARDQYTGPAQFERNTSNPTARMLYPLTPL